MRSQNSPNPRTMSPAFNRGGTPNGQHSPGMQNFSQPNAASAFTQQNTSYHAPIARPAATLPQFNDDLRQPALPFANPSRRGSPASDNADRWRVDMYVAHDGFPANFDVNAYVVKWSAGVRKSS
ncbi:hypothetical protein MRB53_039344 [Persea americana]|nr:hypothetical protein MRB53_039344 [Persea americana]